MRRARASGQNSSSKLAHGLEAFAVEAVEPPGTVAPFFEEARPLEHGQVLAHGLLGEGEVRGDLPGRQLTVADETDDLATMRIRERPQDRIGSSGALGVLGCRHDGSILVEGRDPERVNR